MADVVRFLNWSLGFEQRWPVSIDLEALPDTRRGSRMDPADLRRWVALEVGANLVARWDGAAAPMAFHRGSDRRAAQRALDASSKPILARLEWVAAGSTRADGELTILRCAMPTSLDESPVVVVSEDQLSSAGYRSATSLAEDLTLVSPDQTVLIAQTPLLKGWQSTTCDVSLFAQGGKVLRCMIEGEVGRERLLVKSIEESPLRITGVRFVAIRSRKLPRVILGDGTGEGSDLARLLPSDHLRLRSWLEYETRRKQRDAEQFALREERPLEYDSMQQPVPGRGDRTVFPLILLSADEERLRGWMGAEAEGRSRKASMSVEVYGLDRGVKPVAGTVVGFARSGGRTVARFEPGDPSDVPPARGRLAATSDRGRGREASRRQEALDRIFNGGAACPDLLRWLFDPTSVPGAAVVPRLRARPGERPLNQSQRQAVERVLGGLGLVLVQGPPGTGKTQVIAEMVLHLRDRRRAEARGRDCLAAPVRVLVSSVQNDAVANALTRLQAEGVEVHRRLGVDQRRNADTAGAGRELAERLRRSLELDPAFVRRARLVRLHDAVRSLRSRADSLRSDADVAPAVSDLAGDELASDLPPAILDDLKQLTRNVPGDAIGADPEAPRTRFPGSFGPIERLPELPSLAEAEALRELVGEVIELLERVGDEASLRAAERWRRASRRLQRSIREGELDADAMEAWRDAREATPSAPTTPPGNIPGESLSRWRDDVMAWCRRADDALGLMLREEDRTDGAVLERWMQTLQEEPTRLRELKERHAPVTAATCQLADPGNEPGEEDFFDLVIIDEAARAGIDVLIPMSLGRQIVLVGDHQQLPPHVEEEIADLMEQGLREEARPDESLFRWLWTRLPRSHCVALDRQYRMHEEIGSVVSAVFYEPDLVLQHEFAGERAIERSPRFGLAGNVPLAWIDTRQAMRNRELLQRHGTAWPTVQNNPYESAVITELLRCADRDELRRLQEASPSREVVGVIAFYNDQATQLQSALLALDEELRDMVRVGTVDSFQGMEFPLVLLSCVRSNGDESVGFLRLPQRVNVAISRGQRQVLIVGDAATVARANTPLGSVYSALRGREGAVLPSGEVLR